MCSEEIKNVLVLGTTTFRVSQFCKLFEAYLSYDSYEDALRWQPDLNEDDGIERPSILFNNLHLICTPNLEDSYISKQIISMLSNLEEKQSLSAIIILTNLSQNDGIHLDKLKQHLFRNFEQISDNILYVNVLENDLCKYEQILREQYDMIKKNVFNFNHNTFFNVTAENWLFGVNFCKNIQNYITGNESNCELDTIYINSKLSDELLLKIINNLTELLILIYICINVKHYVDVRGQYKQHQISIGGFKGNITVCHGTPCTQMIKFTDDYNGYHFSVKIPKICHSSCSCLETNKNVAKCMVFDAENKTCKQCKCKTELHSRNYFKTSIATADVNEQQVIQEKQIVINVLATFNFFKKQNQEVLCSEEIFNKFLNIQEGNSKIIFDSFKKEFELKVKQIEATSQPITNKDVLVCINSLYAIKQGATIIPKFIEEIFPKDFRFEMQAARKIKQAASSTPNKTTKIPEASGVDEKMENQVLKNRIIKLEHMMYKILSSNQNDVPEEIGNDLYSQLRQEAASTSNVNLNPNEKNSDEKEMNWNIKAK